MDAKKRDRACGDCMFFQAAPVLSGAQPGQGFCKANPPTAFPVPGPHGQVGAMQLWPPVNSTDWCGKFEGIPLIT